ncbi:arginine--tRNA ligase [soil metagenome]
MATVREILAERLSIALQKGGFPAAAAEVAPASDTRFGDYQTNAAMVLAKQRKANPRQIAGEILQHLDVSDLSETPTIAGAGFLNFTLRPAFLAQSAHALLSDDRLGVAPAGNPRRIVIDFSAPNVAKPMHIGHIRSTMLGECLARVAKFLGHEVFTDNHIGDWGTQFGMVIHGWKNFLDPAALDQDGIAELVRLYREVNALSQTDPSIKQIARDELVKLQQGDPENLAIWQRVIEISLAEIQRLYDLLEVHFDEHLGESFYNDALAPLCEKLTASGIAEISEGALCIFFRDIPALADKPAMIRKTDGGFLYATSDLATIEYRVQRWNPTDIWYVVGSPQALHFQQIFAVARRMGITANLQHIAFGSILGEDRKIMRTRSGENVSLADVLREAVERAGLIVSEKNPELPGAEKDEIARSIGLGAVKYAELSQHRLTDYIFSWDKMLSFQGNTAPYLQNAYVRVRAIFRKMEGEFNLPAELELTTAEERILALKLLQFAELVPVVLEDFRPNLLATYLFELAGSFHSFFEACPVLKSPEPTRSSRLAVCEITARVLRQGLGLLGIRCPERM